MTDKNQDLILETQLYREDELRQLVLDGVTTRTILCAVSRPTRTEWASAARSGLKASRCVTVWADEYEGETVAILDGVRYSVYRTYEPNIDEVELYLEQVAGVT